MVLPVYSAGHYPWIYYPVEFDLGSLGKVPSVLAEVLAG